MDRRRARSILARLAAGKDPKTGRELGPRNPVNRPEVVRALNYAIDVLDGSTQVVVRSSEPRAHRRPRRARQSYRPWTAVEDRAVRAGRAEGLTPSQMAREMDRSAGAVRARLQKLDGAAA